MLNDDKKLQNVKIKIIYYKYFDILYYNTFFFKFE